ncbi:MAG: sigma-70 family RNA polymerase sigma factor [Acidobacteriia bacterium]|nr:sigma-70 family RNA polymerase sigma factor [Terriglobia bacterium]
MSDPDTIEIIEACRRGDREAFRALYEAHKDKVYSIALYFFHGDTAAAGDATQQAFLKLLTSIKSFHGDSEFSTWLHRLVVNTCLDGTRKSKSRERSAEPAELARIADPASPDEALSRRQTASRVQAALSSLPPKLRMPILLRYFEDLSYAEMAQALQCSAGTVASRLSQGHKLLAQKLEKLRR